MKMNKKQPNRWSLLLSAALCATPAFAVAANSEIAQVESRQQASKTCMGTVVDENGEPLMGATVRVKGTTLASSTDLDGKFSLNNVKPGSTIEVSYIGYQPSSTVWNGQALNIQLHESATALDEVVVMGYGVKQKRAKVTNSIAKVDQEVLTVGANANPAQALAGAVSGVKVNLTTGDPGATPSIVIRGGTNWGNYTEKNEPLIVVDGQIRSELSDINPNDVESMDILKDAGATALYGARAANGVVLITTKQGKAGKASVTLNAKFGLNYYDTGYDWVNAHDYIYYSRLGTANTEWFNGNGLTASNQPNGIGRTQITNDMVWNIMTMTEDNKYLLNKGWSSMPDPLDPATTILYRDANIADIQLNTPAYTQDYNLSFSGGNDRGKYYASLGYYNADGAFKKTFYERYNFSLTGSYKITNWLESNSMFTFTRANWNKLPNGFGGRWNGFDTSEDNMADYIFGRVMSLPPTIRFTDEDGNMAFGQNKENSNWNWQPDQFVRENQRDKFQMTQSFTATPIDGLTVKGTMSWYYDETLKESMDKEYQNAPGAIPGSNNGWIRTYNQSASFARYFDQTYNLVANYNRTFAEKHTINAMVGVEFYERQYKGLSASGYGSPTGYWMDLGLTVPGSQNPYQASSRSVDSAHQKERILSYFGRVEYDYMDKYLIAATFREDGYSRLINNRWGFFPGVSAGWVASQEDFFKNSHIADIINYAKIRGSFGMNGIVNPNVIGYYTLQGAYSAYNYNGNYGYRISALPNPNLKWEKTRTGEVGIDLGFLQNRFNLSMTYYNRLTTDKYANYQLPPTTGFSSVVNNNGEFRNQGVEIDFNATLLRTKDFYWTLGANITYNKNVVVKLPENEYKDFNYQQNATLVYSGNGTEKTYIGGLQQGQEPNHLIGYKQAYIIRSEAQLPTGYIDISGARALYTDDEGYARLVEMGRAGNALKLQPGDVVWKDRNGDNMIDTYDQWDLGNRTPHWTGGFNTSLNWKGLQLYARFDMGFDFTVYDPMLAWSLGCGQGSYSFPSQIKDTWTPDNPDAKYPRYVWASQNGTTAWIRTSDILAQSGSYLACRELSLSYALPQNICRKFACQGLTVSVTGQNLGYIKKCTIPLPDNVKLIDGNTAGGGGTYNLPRTLLFGLKLTF